MEYYEYYVPYSLAAADLFLVIGKIAAKLEIAIKFL